jgi:pimeloyl-ACP methyl ester carboxylesterase
MNASSNPIKSGPPLLRRIVVWIIMVIGIPTLFFSGCQSKLIYFPRPYATGTIAQWQKETGGRPLTYQTSQGTQRAFLQGNLKTPKNLWIFSGGNATLALEWSSWIEENAPKGDAWLLFDFPGYGDCQGSATPERIRESLIKVLPIACKEIGWPERPDPERLRFFGHSLGAATCLIAATEFGIQKGILIAPFTSTMDMAQHLIGIPLGPLVWQRFDNGARLHELAARGPGKVIIFHGAEDEIIPFAMSQKLQSMEKDIVDLRAIPGGRHNDILDQSTAEIAAAVRKLSGL